MPKEFQGGFYNLPAHLVAQAKADAVKTSRTVEGIIACALISLRSMPDDKRHEFIKQNSQKKIFGRPLKGTKCQSK